VVFTGVSGSGKSSLAFSTVYAEAQRRYFESVAPYARRLIDQVGVPDVDSIEGLPPAVALQQQRGTPSARSSVGSVTTLSSLIRMLIPAPAVIRRGSRCCMPRIFRRTAPGRLPAMPRPGPRV
jgi:excinuclease ABC subunit A